MEDFHHSHIYLRVSVLPKPYRDDAYAKQLGGKLAAELKSVTGDVAVNINISFDLKHFI